MGASFIHRSALEGKACLLEGRRVTYWTLELALEVRRSLSPCFSPPYGQNRAI
jgi:hypothetical protein